MLNEKKYNLIDKDNKIPEDEPVFLLRAKDRHSFMALVAYMARCKGERHCEKLTKIARSFLQWQGANPDLVKEPD